MRPFQFWKRSLGVLMLSFYFLSTINGQINLTLGTQSYLASAVVDNYNMVDCPAGMNSMLAVICDMNDPFCIPWLPDYLAEFQSLCDDPPVNTTVNYDVFTASANGESYIYLNQYVEIGGIPFVEIDLVIDCGGNGVDGCIENLADGSITCDEGAMGAILAVLEVGELIWSCGDPIPPCVGCDLTISTNTIDPSCGEDNGRITITASNSTPPYQYSIGGAFSSNNSFQNLAPGTYQVTVRDNADCEETTTVVLQNLSNLVVVASAFPTACNENSGSIDLSVSGGNPPYTFTWQPNLGNVEDPSGLAAGFYQVTVSDTDGCTQGIFAQIEVESCPTTDNPVCGFDGVEYANPCEATCAGVGFNFGSCEEEPCICTANYIPVCGSDGVTYSNACVAACAGVTDFVEGACGNDCDCPLDYNPVCGTDGNTYSNACFAECAGVGWELGECEELCICPQIYDPVCGSDGNTYSNACAAECAGVSWEPGACDNPCICQALYDPVCGSDGNTYSNSCYAECAGITEYESGVCNEPCICPPVYDPVCGADGVTYPSPCEAQCAGVEWTAGSCTEDCNCPAIYDPVCGSDGNTYYNSCFAECAGAGWSVGVCEEECLCPDIYDPVCGSDGLTYQNICYAECAGVGWEPGICEELCICPAIYDPVCGTDGNTYSNACYASCAGVGSTSGPCYPPGENILCLPWLVDIIKNFGACGTDEFGGICGQTISLATYQGEVLIVVYDYCDYPFNSGYTETVYNQDGVALDQCERVINSINCDFFPPQGAIIDALTNREEIWNCGDGLPECVCDLTFSVNTSIPDCGDDNGSIVVNASGGTPPYTYYLGGEASSIGIFTGLAEGVYNIVVTDSGGCSEEVNAVLFSEGYPYCLGGVITIISELSGCTPVVYEVSGTFPNSCSELIDTDLLIDGNWFITNVSVSNDPPPCTTPGDDWAETFNLGILPPGNYTIELRINSELITSTSITILGCQDCAIGVSLAGTPPSCGETDGSVIANVTGGTPPFSYNFGTGFQTSNTLSSLSEGTYEVTVMDAEGCTAQDAITLSCTPLVAPMFFATPSTITRDVGAAFSLLVSVDDFTDITDLQLPITWNSEVITFQGVAGFNGTLGLDQSSFTTPSSGGPPGQLVLNWDDPSGQGVSLPDDFTLFTISFLAVAEGGTDFAFRDDIGIPAEIIGTGGVDYDLQATDAQVTIIDATGVLTFVLPDIVVEQGENFCLPITVLGFENIVSMQGSINFNPGVLSFSGFQNFNPAVTGFGPSSFGTPGTGNLTYTWIDFLQSGIDLPDGSTLVELCFTAIGEEESEVVFSSTPTTIEVTNGEENIVPFQSEGSTVSFVMEEPGTFDLSFSTANACAGEVFCLDVTADNFTNITAFTFPVVYDPVALAVNQITNFNSTLGGFASGSVNTDIPGEVAVDWEAVANSATSLDPSSLLFTICFEKLVDSDTEVEITATANTPVAVTDVNGDPVSFAGLAVTITGDDCVSTNDQDNDGYSSDVDCDDTNPEINPGAEEIPGNDVDENCDDIIAPLPTDVLTFIGGDEVGGVGDTVMIPITVQNFTNISGFQFTMVIPEADQGTFVEFVEGTAITGISVNPANGIFRAIWNIPLGAPPVDLPDDTIVFWVKIALTGEPGECSIFSFSNFPTPISAVEGLDNSFVPVTLSGTFCVRETVDITGILQTEYELPVSGAEVECSDGQTYTTDADGVYTFTEIPADADYVIEPHRDMEHPAGVTVGDVVLIRAHIIGLQDLDSPYKIIAGDANADDIVTVLDLITLQRVIIGFLDTFPNNESWRFIPESYEFDNPLFPLLEDFPESLQLPALMDDVVDGDFVSIKVGDVNEDVILPLQGGTSITFTTIEQEYKAGETISIPIYRPGEKPPIGWQVAFEFDPDQLQVLSVLGPNGQPLMTHQLHLEKEGLRAIWYEQNLQASDRGDEALLLQIVVQAVGQGKLSDALKLDAGFSRIADRQGNESIVERLSFTSPPPAMNKLQVGTCYPLPFREQCTLAIESSQREWATLRIVSPDGTTIWQYSGELFPGLQHWQVSSEVLPTSGLYFYHLQSPSGTFMGKLIHNR